MIFMGWKVVYDGRMSGSLISGALIGETAAKCLAIPYANGQRVVIVNDGT